MASRIGQQQLSRMQRDTNANTKVAKDVSLSSPITEYVDWTELPSHKQSVEYWIKDLQLFTSDKKSLEMEIG